MSWLPVTYLCVTLLSFCLSVTSQEGPESGRGQGRSNRDLQLSIRDAIREGKDILKALKKELKQFKDEGIDREGRSSIDRHNMVTQSRAGADRLAEIGKVSVEVTKRLVERNDMTVDEVASSPEVQRSFRSEFCPVAISCQQARDSAYRSVDGSCNNLDHPEWGAAVTPQPRYQRPQYDDGVDAPRSIGVGGGALPSPRLVSNRLFRAPEECTETDYARTLMVMAWGQFVDHDIVATPVTQGDGAPITCCGQEVENRTYCFPISIPADDPHFTDSCMEFVRSAPAPAVDGCQAGPREQINQITSFIDGGVVYGDTNMKWLELVDTNTGSMLMSDGNLLPSGGNCKPSHSEDFCQLAGDHRVNVIPSLGGSHLAFAREHNRILDELRNVRPDWDATTLFQEARKIIGALLQQITYREYLPSILSEQDLVKYDLKLQSTGHSASYDSSRNPAAKNVFNAAAFRFGHSQIPGTYAYILRDFMTRLQSTPTEATLMDPHMLITESGKRVPDLTRFVITSNSMKVDNQFDGSMRDHLFEGPDKVGSGFDLGALNLQRGRDHGLPAYNAWREWCGLPVATSFADLQDMNEENRKAMADLYSDVDDIDVYAGGVSETLLDGAAVGPLFACIIGNQFRDLKNGDRYWYENRGKEGFKKGQLKEIRKVTLAKILCENMGVDPITSDVFHVPNPRNTWQSCESLPGINFSAWKRRGRH